MIMLAAVRVRGQVDVTDKISATLDSLGLRKKNQVVLIEEDNEAHKGMLNKAKDYIAYGEVSEEVAEKLQEKSEDGAASLTPPSGGFKDTRKNVAEGGALGKRKDMDKLVQKML
ncbi:MAG: uL30 family ribosomal protein [Candidatus Nanosalina sp.]